MKNVYFNLTTLEDASKSDFNQAPSILDSGEELRLLGYSGMKETIRICREQYAIRESHSSFFNRLSVLLDRNGVNEGQGKESDNSSRFNQHMGEPKRPTVGFHVSPWKPMQVDWFLWIGLKFGCNNVWPVHVINRIH